MVTHYFRHHDRRHKWVVRLDAAHYSRMESDGIVTLTPHSETGHPYEANLAHAMKCVLEGAWIEVDESAFPSGYPSFHRGDMPATAAGVW